VVLTRAAVVTQATELARGRVPKEIRSRAELMEDALLCGVYGKYVVL